MIISDSFKSISVQLKQIRFRCLAEFRFRIRFWMRFRPKRTFCFCCSPKHIGPRFRRFWIYELLAGVIILKNRCNCWRMFLGHFVLTLTTTHPSKRKIAISVCFGFDRNKKKAIWSCTKVNVWKEPFMDFSENLKIVSIGSLSQFIDVVISKVLWVSTVCF